MTPGEEAESPNDPAAPAFGENASPPDPARRCVEHMMFAGRRVLVVEDDFLVSLATTDLLESIGCVIVGPAARIAAALRLVQSEPLDAAVLDIDIAGEMVWPVAEELRRRDVPFLFLSAYRQIGAHRLFADAPRLDKPLEQYRLVRELSAIWRV